MAIPGRHNHTVPDESGGTTTPPPGFEQAARLIGQSVRTAKKMTRKRDVDIFLVWSTPPYLHPVRRPAFLVDGGRCPRAVVRPKEWHLTGSCGRIGFDLALERVLGHSGRRIVAMFGRHERQLPAKEQEVAVDVNLEQDIGAAERSIQSYLATPGENQRKDLLAVLERLDRQIDLSDSYDSSIIGSGALGLATKFSVIGETSSSPVVDQVPPAEFQAQVTLVKAAKRAVNQPSSEATTALHAAYAALTAVRARDPADPPQPG